MLNKIHSRDLYMCIDYDYFLNGEQSKGQLAIEKAETLATF